MGLLKCRTLNFLFLGQCSHLPKSFASQILTRLLFTSKSFCYLEGSEVSGVSRGKSSFVLARNILKLRDLGLLQSVLPRNRYFYPNIL